MNAEFSNPPHSSEGIYFAVGDTILNRDMVSVQLLDKHTFSFIFKFLQVKVIDKTSAILHVEKPPRSSSVYFCKDSEGVVCLNQVIVDSKFSES